MHHCLAILLLVFLPFQFSWAAVGTYCEHEAGPKAQHFGHHEHEHRQVAVGTGEDTKSKAGAALDVADCHFHCQCVVDLPASLVMPTVGGINQLTDWADADALAPVSARPERPQWIGYA